jgi:DNA-binding CsgD family transcriptional regulator
MINRNRVLVEQKNRLMGLSVKAKESVRESLEDVISIIDEYLNDDKDWAYIEPQLDKVYNNFVSRLKEKHRDLNLSEIKIAAYVRMNLGTKEISEFMHKTPRAIENDRYRLRKKIGLDSNDSLKQYLMNL